MPRLSVESSASVHPSDSCVWLLVMELRIECMVASGRARIEQSSLALLADAPRCPSLPPTPLAAALAQAGAAAPALVCPCQLPAGLEWRLRNAVLPVASACSA